MKISNSIQFPNYKNKIFTSDIGVSISQLKGTDTIAKIVATGAYNKRVFSGIATDGFGNIIIKTPGTYYVTGIVNDTVGSLSNGYVVCANNNSFESTSVSFLILNISIPTGSIVTATLDDYVFTETSINNKCVLYLPKSGLWKLHATDGNQNTYSVANCQGFGTYDITMTYGDNNAGYRGENLLATSHFSNIDNLYNAVKAGNMNDVWVGDYITYNNIKYIVMGVDFYKDKGVVENEAHHLVIVPEQILGLASMNSSDTNATGYAGSEMHKTTLPNTYLPIMNAALGNHILNGTWTLTTDNTSSITTTTTEQTCKIRLLNEMAVFGENNYMNESTNSSIADGEMDTILPGFKLNPGLTEKIYKEENILENHWWISSRPRFNTNCFMYIQYSNSSSYNDATTSYGVVPMVLFG